MTNPLRAQRASQLVRRLPAPNPDGGSEDAGLGNGNPDGGDLVDGQEFWWIGAISPASSFPNNGVESVMEEVDTVPPKGNGCFDCWTSETLDNGYWGQVGFAACNLPGSGSFVSTFYQIWNTKPPEQLLVDARVVQNSPGIHSYAMRLQGGTTWTYSVDGTVFGAWNMDSATSSSPGAIATLCEEGDGVSAPFVPPSVSVPVAMSLFDVDAGSWSGAPAANVYNTADLSGAAGNLQDDTLDNGAVRIGGSIAFTKAGTKLWKGATAGFAPDAGPAGTNALAPPLLRLTAPAPGAVVSGTAQLAGTVVPASAGPAISVVTFFVENEAGIVFQAQGLGPLLSTTWDTTAVANGAFDVFLQAVDAKGLQTYVDIPVTVDNQPGSASSSTGTSTGGGASSTGGGFGSSAATGTTSSSLSSSSSGGATGGPSGGSSTGFSEGTIGGAPDHAVRGTGCATGSGEGSLVLLSLIATLRIRRCGRSLPG